MSHPASCSENRRLPPLSHLSIICFLPITSLPLASPLIKERKCNPTRRRPRYQPTLYAVSVENPSPTPKSTVDINSSQIKTPVSPSEHNEITTRMFSNVIRDTDGALKRDPPSELACTALVTGTMIGAGVLALPTVAEPSGFLPSTTVLLAIWVYMSATGLLISEVTINTACSLGRSSGISMLSLGRLTLGPIGGIITAFSYILLHYAILTAYTAQGGQLIHQMFPSLPSVANGTLFSLAIGLPMLLAPARFVANVNNVAVAGAAIAFAAVITFAAPQGHIAILLHSSHWLQAINFTGSLIPVAFVSCVYHNVVSTVTMRLEGDRAKIRKVILLGSGIPVLMFVMYDGVMLSGAGVSHDGGSGLAISVFSALAIATSYVGFVEGMTELYADVRATIGFKMNGRWMDFVATLAPPIALAAISPDVFFRALDVAGTYGIAVLFGLIPAAMAWETRSKEGTKEFRRLVSGGNLLLGGIATVPVALIATRLWSVIQHHVG